MGGWRNYTGGYFGEGLEADRNTGKGGNKPATFGVALRCSWADPCRRGCSGSKGRWWRRSSGNGSDGTAQVEGSDERWKAKRYRLSHETSRGEREKGQELTRVVLDGDGGSEVARRRRRRN